jgi:hypothetical protein
MIQRVDEPQSLNLTKFLWIPIDSFFQDEKLFASFTLLFADLQSITLRALLCSNFFGGDFILVHTLRLKELLVRSRKESGINRCLQTLGYDVMRWATSREWIGMFSSSGSGALRIETENSVVIEGRRIGCRKLKLALNFSWGVWPISQLAQKGGMGKWLYEVDNVCCGSFPAPLDRSMECRDCFEVFEVLQIVIEADQKMAIYRTEMLKVHQRNPPFSTLLRRGQIRVSARSARRASGLPLVAMLGFEMGSRGENLQEAVLKLLRQGCDLC